VRNVDYDPDQVVSIVGQFRHAIEIQFGPGETVTQAALGDTISWQIAPVGNIVFLKPREKAEARTSSSSPTPTEARAPTISTWCSAAAAMYGIRFHYPKEERAAAALQAQMATIQAARSVENGIVTAALDHAVIEGTRNMNYTVQGDARFSPPRFRTMASSRCCAIPAMPTFPRSLPWTWTGQRRSFPMMCARISSSSMPSIASSVSGAATWSFASTMKAPRAMSAATDRHRLQCRRTQSEGAR
jgi:hypothetical protein